MGIGLGYAGTGKTFALKTAVDAAKREGYNVIGVTETGQAAEVLAQETGIPCQTLTKFLGDYRLPLSAAVRHHGRQLWRAARHRRTWRFRQPRPVRITPDDIVLVDEAGMISTRHMRLLVEAVELGGGAVWLVGDPMQLPSVESTPPLNALVRRYGAAALKEICRQKETWAQDAAKLFAEGKPGPALAMFAEHKQVTVRDDIDEAVQQACLDWTAEGLLNPDRVLILANTNELAHSANTLAQEHRLRAGCIHPSPSLRITDEQDDAVYESRVYRGDRVVFTQNTPAPPYGHGVKNGSRGTVIEINSFTSEIAVVLDNKKHVKVNVRKYPHIRLAYAVTTYKSQGASIPRILTIVGGTLQNLPASYVQATRAIEQTQFYTTKDLLSPYMDDVAGSPLAKQMANRPDLRLATELLQDAPLDLRPRDLRLRGFADFAARHPQKKGHMKVVGMSRTFWVVMAPIPTSTLDDICFHCNFAEFAANAVGETGFRTRTVVGIYAAKKDAVAVASQLIATGSHPDLTERQGGSIKTVGMPQTFWVVTKPNPRSTLRNLYFQSSFEGFALQMRGGLTINEVFGICTTEEDAVAAASKLLETMQQSDTSKIPIFPGQAEINTVGMPSSFWVVMKPTPTSTIRHICVHSSFEHFLFHARNGLPIEDIAGVYATKKVAGDAAAELLRTVRQPPQKNVTAAVPDAPEPAAATSNVFWVVKIPTLSSTINDIFLECDFTQLAAHAKAGLTAEAIFAIYATKEEAVAAATMLLGIAAGTADASTSASNLPAPNDLLPVVIAPPSGPTAVPAVHSANHTTQGSEQDRDPGQRAVPDAATLRQMAEAERQRGVAAAWHTQQEKLREIRKKLRRVELLRRLRVRFYQAQMRQRMEDRTTQSEAVRQLIVGPEQAAGTAGQQHDTTPRPDDTPTVAHDVQRHIASNPTREESAPWQHEQQIARERAAREADALRREAERQAREAAAWEWHEQQERLRREREEYSRRLQESQLQALEAAARQAREEHERWQHEQQEARERAVREAEAQRREEERRRNEAAAWAWHEQQEREREQLVRRQSQEIEHRQQETRPLETISKEERQFLLLIHNPAALAASQTTESISAGQTRCPYCGGFH